MTLRSGYGPEHPELDGFLLAEIGIASNGLPLTVQSAFARLDQDPHAAAEYLLGAPSEAALGAMTELVVALPAGSWSDRDARDVASDLLARLPRDPLGARRQAAAGATGGPVYGLTLTRILVLAGFTALAAYAIWGMGEESRDNMDLSSGPSSGPPAGVSSLAATAISWTPHARERQASHASI